MVNVKEMRNINKIYNIKDDLKLTKIKKCKPIF